MVILRTSVTIDYHIIAIQKQIDIIEIRNPTVWAQLLKSD